MSEDTGSLSKSFVENAEDLNEDQATQLLIESEKKIKLIKEQRAADPKLKAAKDIAKELGAGYTSALNYEKSKISFLLDKIEEIQNGQVNPTSGAND